VKHRRIVSAMTFYIKYIINLSVSLFFLLAIGIAPVFGQEQERDGYLTPQREDLPTAPVLDSLVRDTLPVPMLTQQPVIQRKKFIPPKPYALEIYLDYLKLTSLAVDYEQKYEGGVGILFSNRMILVFEAGHGTLTPRNAYKNSNYTIEGNYGRIGVDYLLPFDPKNNFTVGLRYGRSYFQDQATYMIDGGMWDGYQNDFKRTNLIGHWSEIVIGSESELRKNMTIGFMFRFRILNSFANPDSSLPVFAIPGYGRTQDKTIPALNLFIKYRLPFKKPVILPNESPTPSSGS
jgi:hypothetical protein